MTYPTPCGKKDCCCPKTYFKAYKDASRIKNPTQRKKLKKIIKRVANARRKKLGK